MKSYIITLYYPHNKYNDIKTLLDNALNNDVFFIVEDFNGIILSENIPQHLDISSYDQIEFIMMTKDFFIPLNIKEYLSSNKTNYIIKDKQGKIIYNTHVKNFFEPSNASTFQRFYDLYNYDSMKIYFDHCNLTLYVINNEDFYYNNNMTLLDSAYGNFSRKTNYRYSIVDTNISIDHTIVKFQLKEKKYKKLLKNFK